jgi:hypothetical protein
MRYSKNNLCLVVIIRSHIACAHCAVARPQIGERKESGGRRYTGCIHSGKFKAKLIKLEWSVNGKRYSGDFFQHGYTKKFQGMPKFSINIDRAKLD